MLVLLASLLLLGRPPDDARAAELRLPPNATDLPRAIAVACPTCADAGYTACGSQEVRWGDGFAATALLGSPKRGYLATFTMTGEEFRALARQSAYASLRTILTDRFASTRLVVLDDGFAAARVLPTPDKVAVTFPAPLHACVRDTTWPWACCASDCDQECCEKSLGSPAIDLEWQDGDEHLHYHYTHTIGTTWLKRRTPRRTVHYACLTDARGTLRSAGDPLPIRDPLQR